MRICLCTCTHATSKGNWAMHAPAAKTSSIPAMQARDQAMVTSSGPSAVTTMSTAPLPPPLLGDPNGSKLSEACWFSLLGSKKP